MSNHRPQPGATEELSLAKAAELLLEECRMILPGIQALFGFQLIVVFNPGFDDRLSSWEKQLHVAAVFLVALAVALIMTPAAYHRQTDPYQISDAFIRLSTRLVLWSMFPLALALVGDLYIVARIAFAEAVSGLISIAVASAIIGLWFALPRVRSMRQFLAQPQARHEFVAQAGTSDDIPSDRRRR